MAQYGNFNLPLIVHYHDPTLCDTESSHYVKRRP